MKLLAVLAAATCAVAASPERAAAQRNAQAAIDGCIDQLRAVGGPDARAGGEVLSQSWSQAGTLVRLRDAGGTVWECIGYDDGTVGDLSVVAGADDGGGAMAGATAEGPVAVHFQRGTTGATYDGTLGAGDAIQYVLGARDGQFLTVRIAANGGAVDYQIRNPDGSNLLDMVGAGTPYEGQLWQSGDHVVEVVNRTSAPQSYRVEFGIR